MTDLVEYLRQKLETAKATICSCPSEELRRLAPSPGFVFGDCAEHGRVALPALGWMPHD